MLELLEKEVGTHYWALFGTADGVQAFIDHVERWRDKL